ncbi:hypothetical protein GE061_004754 [Apolygus lucorum]|uniref:Sushi domain-containing protein n=1 Tax=Apolygus lucorum TaxID=248454 RepID=A0A8S9X2Q4_APOLU|nr:hypothetical protein GE061_004754 [Apolygus lucorum]
MKPLIPLLVGSLLLAGTSANTRCRFPGAPAHSTVEFSDPSLNVGTVGTYLCEPGFELLGPSRRICTPQGTWTPEGIPFCVLNVAAGKAPMQCPGWYVNLLEPYMVQLVRLDFGKPCCGKNKPATVVVRVGNNRPDLATNPICNRFTGTLEEGEEGTNDHLNNPTINF